MRPVWQSMPTCPAARDPVSAAVCSLPPRITGHTATDHQICHQRYTTCSLSSTLLLTGFPVVALRGDDIYRSTSI